MSVEFAGATVIELVGAAKGDPSRYRLSKFAAEHAAEMVDAPKATRDAIRDEVRKALKNGEGPNGIADRLFERVDLPAGRLQAIADTEYVIARTGARLEQFDANGADAKEWVLSPGEVGCPICQALDGQVVGLDEMFEHDGEQFDGPPAHTHCGCDVQEAAVADLKAAVSFIGAADFDETKHPRDEKGRFDAGTSADNPLYSGSAQEDFLAVADLIDKANGLPVEKLKKLGDVRSIVIDKITSDQETVDSGIVTSFTKQVASPNRSEDGIGIRYKDRVFLVDGNHRVSARKAVGEKYARIRIINSDLRAAITFVGAGSPDQPRDDHGRWTSEGGVVYHGTDAANVENILKQGLAPDRETVYTTSSKSRAESFAKLNSRYDSHGAVLEIHVPKDRMKEFGATTSRLGDVHRSFAGTIPASWVKVVHKVAR